MAILIKDGEITGCQQNGHMVLCTNCQVSNTANCPDNESREKLPLKPLGTVYEKVALEIAKLVSRKQAEYGDSFGNSHKIFEVLYPDGVKLDQMKDFLVIVRVVDKLFRIARGDQGDESAWDDINGYSNLAAVRARKEKNVI